MRHYYLIIRKDQPCISSLWPICQQLTAIGGIRALSLSLVCVYICCVIILLTDDSEETREFIASVFQPVQLGCERYVELMALSRISPGLGAIPGYGRINKLKVNFNMIDEFCKKPNLN